MVITRISDLTGKTTTMDLPVTQAQLDEYAKGIELIQNVFPYIGPQEREFIKTGITPKEWDEVFGEED